MVENSKFRHEIKYQCSEIQLAIIRARLQALMQYDHHAQNGQYTIRSMYFDNYGNRCFYENERGTDPREKFRIRIYNASDKRISLECKRKERGKTQKTSCLLTKDQYYALVNGEGIANLTAQPEVLRKFHHLIQTQHFVPSVIVEYDRIPFIYPVGNVRITLDRNIRSSNDFAHFFREHIPARPILPTGQHLLEVKYDELLPGFIKNVLQLGDLQQTTFSKFYLCKKHSISGVTL